MGVPGAIPEKWVTCSSPPKGCRCLRGRHTLAGRAPLPSVVQVSGPPLAAWWLEQGRQVSAAAAAVAAQRGATGGVSGSLPRPQQPVPHAAGGVGVGAFSSLLSSAAAASAFLPPSSASSPAPSPLTAQGPVIATHPPGSPPAAAAAAPPAAETAVGGPPGVAALAPPRRPGSSVRTRIGPAARVAAPLMSMDQLRSRAQYQRLPGSLPANSLSRGRSDEDDDDDDESQDGNRAMARGGLTLPSSMSDEDDDGGAEEALEDEEDEDAMMRQAIELSLADERAAAAAAAASSAINESQELAGEAADTAGLPAAAAAPLPSPPFSELRAAAAAATATGAAIAAFLSDRSSLGAGDDTLITVGPDDEAEAQQPLPSPPDVAPLRHAVQPPPLPPAPSVLSSSRGAGLPCVDASGPHAAPPPPPPFSAGSASTTMLHPSVVQLRQSLDALEGAGGRPLEVDDEEEEDADGYSSGDAGRSAWRGNLHREEAAPVYPAPAPPLPPLAPAAEKQAELVAQYCEVAGVTEAEARLALAKYCWDIDFAMEMAFPSLDA